MNRDRKKADAKKLGAVIARELRAVDNYAPAEALNTIRKRTKGETC